MVPFTTHTEQRDGATVVALSGDLDIATRRAAREALQAALAEGGGPLVLDLTAVGFLDSTGLTVLVNTANDAQRAGRSFAVVAPDGQARRTLEISGIEEELNVVSTLAEATS